MAYFYIAFLIIGIILIIFLVLGLPRKKNARKLSIEGLDDPKVAKVFEKMTNLVPFKILRRRILSELEKFNPAGKLVDLGCGSGNLLVLISKKYPNLELIGVDISSEILELAKFKTQENELTVNVDFRVGCADNLPFPDNSVDFIVSSLSLHHWKDPSIVLKETHRVLKHNGVLEFFDFRRDSRKFFYGLLTFVTKVVVPKPLKKIKEPIGSLQAGYTPIEIKELISNSPFKNEEIEFYLAWMFIKMIKE